MLGELSFGRGIIEVGGEEEGYTNIYFYNAPE
jgi:hypothetical protein